MSQDEAATTKNKTGNEHRNQISGAGIVDDNFSLLTKKSNASHPSLFSRVKGFFTFGNRNRKKKFKVNNDLESALTIKDQNDLHDEPKLIRSDKRYRSLPHKNKRKLTEEKKSKDDSDIVRKRSDEGKENEEKEEEEHVSFLVRLRRTFSFIYKRNNNTTTNNNNRKVKRRVSNPPQKSRSTQDLKKSQRQGRRTRTRSDADYFSSLSSSSRRSESRSKSPPISLNIPNGDIIRNTTDDNPGIDLIDSPVKNDNLEALVASQEDDGENEDDESKELIAAAKVVEDFSIPSVRTVPEQTKRRHLVCSGVETPAVAGIQNHGNTCFINAIIQCLSNTNPFAEYFVLDYYRDDLSQNRSSMTLPPASQRNKNLSRNYLQHGELSEHLALLLKSLWAGMYSSEYSSKFKTVVARHFPQYAGCGQHDAQEFLLELLNKIGEELSVQDDGRAIRNGSVRKSHTDKIGRRFSREKSDETAAVEHLAKCQPTNANSIIIDLFQWQHRAITVCHECGNSPKTFDPYLHIPLPVPARNKFTIFVHVLFRSRPQERMKKYGLSLEATTTLRALRDKISRNTRIPEICLLLLRPDQDKGMVEFFDNQETIQNVFEDGATIQALETEPIIAVDSETPQMCQQMLTIVWLNRIDNHGSIFGPFFTRVVSREISFRKLTEKILTEMSPYMVSDNGEIDFAKINIRLRLVDGIEGQEYLEPEVDHPLFVKAVEYALAKIEKRKEKEKYQGPYHLKLMVEWDLDVRQSILVTDENFDIISGKRDMVIDESAKRAPDHSRSTNRTSVYDCLDLFFQDENLTNSWQCSACGSPQQCTRQLSIWSLPDILILHLKRFHSVSQSKNAKIDTLIDYPQNGLDLLKYVQRRFEPNGDIGTRTVPSFSKNSSSKLSYQRVDGNLDETTYNLFAVCRHHGSMQRGHYTAFCKNSVDNCWYLYDDTKVVPISENEVVTADAYILFYQKSYVHTAYYDNYHSIKRNHWVARMPPFYAHLNGTRTTPHPKKTTNGKTNHSNNDNHLSPLNTTKLNNSSYQTMNGYSGTLKKYQQPNHYDENDHHNGTMNNGYYHHHHSNNGLKSKYY